MTDDARVGTVKTPLYKEPVIKPPGRYRMDLIEWSFGRHTRDFLALICQTVIYATGIWMAATGVLLHGILWLALHAVLLSLIPYYK